MKPPFVFIIVLQYNNSKDTLNCLDSLRQLRYPNFKVAVVDNDSNQPEKNIIKNYLNSQEGITLLENKENLGYAGGNNIGIKYSLANNADYVFILNNDTTVEPDCLEKLVEAAEMEAKTGIVGPAINEGDKITYGGKIRWLKSELQHSTLKPKSQNLKPGFYISGAAMLIKKSVIEKIGLFDERYFLYFEDADYCLRAQQAGYVLAIVPDALVRHKVSATTSRLGSAALLYYHYRNGHLFNFKNAPWIIKIVLPLWSFYIIIKQLIKITFASDKRQVSIKIFQGITDFYRKKFGRLT